MSKWKSGHPFRGNIVSDERLFLPTWHNRYKRPRKLEQKSYWKDLIDELKKLNFQHSTSEFLSTVQGLIEKFQKKNWPAIPLGMCGMISYSLAPEVLATRSLNSDADTMKDSKKEFFVNLNFVDTKDENQASSIKYRHAIVLGRLEATHHTAKFAKSRWVIVLDETHLLWALYANGFDDSNLEHAISDKTRPYKMTSDTAFGADRVQERVVRLGSLQDIPFKSDRDLTKFQVHSLDWFTQRADLKTAYLSNLTIQKISIAEEPEPKSEETGDQMDVD